MEKPSFDIDAALYGVFKPFHRGRSYKGGDWRLHRIEMKVVTDKIRVSFCYGGYNEKGVDITSWHGTTFSEMKFQVLKYLITQYDVPVEVSESG